MAGQSACLDRQAQRQLTSVISRDPEIVLAAQHLRHSVFAAEFGAQFDSSEPQIDRDRFDDYCDHVVVFDGETVVATTRILSWDGAQKAGGFYSEGEFELSGLKTLGASLAEVGRTCVHPDYHNGATIAMLWNRVGEYLQERSVKHVMGCASISMNDGGGNAWRIYQRLARSTMAPEALQVSPTLPLPESAMAETDSNLSPVIPALIRAYVRLGARVCGQPCWDPDFNCADIPVVLEVAAMAPRYARHFMGRGR